jgi:4-hydroxy-3-methylbut-2-enyl diphosphate reductase
VLETNFTDVIDGTCPHVARVSKIIERATREGRDVVIVGNRQHPEVSALVAAVASGKCFTANSDDEILLLPKKLTRPLIISQSTAGIDHFNDISSKITKAYLDAEIIDTICASSKARQHAIVNLKTRGAQAVVVVGGKHSNNTVVLAQTAKNIGLPVFHIETVSDLRTECLKNFSIVGVASGASTDTDDIADVVDFLEKL